MGSGQRGRFILVVCLIFSATFFASLAVLLPTVIVPEAKKLPSDVSQQVMLTASDATVLDNTALAAGIVRSETNIPLQVEVNVTSAPPTNDKTVTLVAAVRTTRTDRDGLEGIVSGYVDKVSLNRKSAAPQDVPVPLTIHASTGVATETPRTGYQYNFPLGVERHEYPVYDSEARLTTQAQYLDDERTVQGVRLFHFQQRIENLNLQERLGDVASLEMPSQAWGIDNSQEPVRMALYYSVVRDLWVDPATGMIVDQRQDVLRQLGNTDGFRVTSLQADLHFSASTVTENAKEAQRNGRLLFWGSTGVPILLGILSAGLLVFATALGRSASRSRTEDPDHDQPGSVDATSRWKESPVGGSPTRT